MANLPISGLGASASNLSSTDVAPVVQTTGVGPVKMTGMQFAGGLLGATCMSGETIDSDKKLIDHSVTWDNAAVTFTGWKLDVTDTASASGSLLLNLQVGGSSKFSVSKVAKILADGKFIEPQPSSNNLWFGFGTRYTFGFLGTNRQVRINGTYNLTWSQSDQANHPADLFLGRRAAASLRLGAADAAAPVAQTLSVQSVVAGTTNTAGVDFTIAGSQGTGTGAGGSIIFQVAPAGSSGSAQNDLFRFAELSASKALRLYNAYTDASNYERLTFSFSGTDAVLGTQNAGTGSARSLIFVAGNSSRWFINGSAGHFLASSDNSYDIGASAASRPRDLFLARNLVQGAAYYETTETTAPAAPAADKVRIYAEDDGAGKTRLMALFATGAAQQIAIEP